MPPPETLKNYIIVILRYLLEFLKKRIKCVCKKIWTPTTFPVLACYTIYVYVWRNMCCCQDLKRCLMTLWQRLVACCCRNNNHYKRVSQSDEESLIGDDRNRSSKTEEVISLKQQLNDIEKQLNVTEEQLSIAKRQLSEAESNASVLRQNLRASEKAKSDALSRLSEHVALKLSDNNPNIADLSDQNRPTNLAEKFSALYDDQWTDAFDALMGDASGEENEKKAIQYLLKIVQDCFTFCREESDRQLQQLVASYGTTMEPLPREMVKMTKDTRKKYAFVRVTELQQAMLGTIGTKLGPIVQHDAIQAYIKRCTELCWLMSVQDPPMALCSEVGPNQKYDKLRYRDYMKAGEYIDYVVWPCVLIQDGGNLMSKGVAQCKDQSYSETLVAID